MSRRSAERARPATAGGPLSADQVARFAGDGYLLCPDFIDEPTHEALLRGADGLIELVVNSTVALARRNPRADIHYDGTGALVIRRISPVADALPAAAALAASARMTGAARQLIGAPPVLAETKLNYKQRFPETPRIPFLPVRNGGDQWPLHHDWGYFRQQGYPRQLVAVAISLDDQAGRGPMVVVPGSHRDPVRLASADPDSGSGRVTESTVGPRRVAIDAPARAALFFHCLLVHSSPPNASRHPRRILHLTYAPPLADGTAATRRNGRWQESAERFEGRYRKLLEAGRAGDRFRVRTE